MLLEFFDSEAILGRERARCKRKSPGKYKSVRLRMLAFQNGGWASGSLQIAMGWSPWPE